MTVQPTRDQLRALADAATDDGYTGNDNYGHLTVSPAVLVAVLDQLDAAEQRIRDLTQEVRDERGAALDQMEQVRIRDARIKAVRDVLDAEERSVANLDRGACGIGDGWSAAVSVSDIRRALGG